MASWNRIGPGGQLIVWLVVASIGNPVGGVGFVTLFGVAQVKEKQRQGYRY